MKRAVIGKRNLPAIIVPPVPPVLPTDLLMPHAAPLTWERAMEPWEGRLQSVETRRTYKHAVTVFFTWPGVPERLDLLTIEILDAYGGRLRQRADKGATGADRVAPATANTYLTGLRSFLTFCRKRYWLSAELSAEVIADALHCLKSQTRRPYQIVEGGAEWDRLLEAAAQDHYDPMRAVALVTLALGSGLRISELCALDVGDIASDATGAYVDVRRGKGNKDRQVPIDESVHTVLMHYLETTGRAIYRTADRGTPLFVSRKHSQGAGRITPRHAGRVINEAVTKAEIPNKRITAHGLRHSYAIRVLKGDADVGQTGAPLPALSKLLGHSSIAVTGRYLDHFERSELMRYAPQVRRKETA